MDKEEIRERISESLVKFEDGVCYVKLSGACADCNLIEFTLKDGIEVAITSEVPEVIEVRNID